MDLAKNLKIDSVSRLQPTTPVQVSPAQTAADAAALMRKHGVGCLLVCDRQKLVGIFTERDLMRRVLAAGKPLTSKMADCMTANPVAVHPKDSIATAIRHMETGGYRHLPVVDEAGRPVGVFSVKRIVRYLVEHFPTTVYNLPPDPDVVPKERDGA